MSRQSLTALAQERMAAVLGPGDIAVDATAGNGLDTLRLARLVGETGRVHAVDIQPEALEMTRARLLTAGVHPWVELHRGSHGALLDLLGYELQGRVRGVMFNLGYRPGGDQRITTSPASTIPALRQASTLLAPGGRLSVMAYTGHDGGALEARAVVEWSGALGAPFSAREVRPPGTPPGAPRLLLVDRAAAVTRESVSRPMR